MRGYVGHNGTAANSRRGAHYRGSLLEPRPLARPVGDIDERAGIAGEVILRSMMAQVGRDESIGTGRCRQEGIPCSPAYGDGAH